MFVYLYGNQITNIMEARLKLEQELKSLERLFKEGKSGMTTNEYCSYYNQMSKKIQSLNHL